MSQSTENKQIPDGKPVSAERLNRCVDIGREMLKAAGEHLDTDDRMKNDTLLAINIIIAHVADDQPDPKYFLECFVKNCLTMAESKKK